jgi:hypothetical protein
MVGVHPAKVVEQQICRPAFHIAQHITSQQAAIPSQPRCWPRTTRTKPNGNLHMPAANHHGRAAVMQGQHNPVGVMMKGHHALPLPHTQGAFL